jgi:apolipoprotein N-acyltransferase
VLALAPFFVSPVLFITLPVLVWLIDGSSPSPGMPFVRGGGMRAAAIAGWWFGFGYFLAGLFWIGEAFLVESEKFAWALPFAVTLLPAGLALFYGAAAAAARAFWGTGPSRLLVLAIALAVVEWLRGHVLTGFPWNVLGYSLTFPLVLMQGAAVLGIYGLTLWAVIIFSAPLVLAGDAQGPGRRREALKGIAAAALPLLTLAAYGALRLSDAPAPMLDGVRLRIVQPSVPQREKWRPENQGPIFRDHLELSRHDAAGRRDDLEGITHVVWPEAAMPFLPLEHPEALEAIGGLLPRGTYLLSGALRRESPAASPEAGGPVAQRRAYNSLMAFGPGGGLAALYDKIHLVPFGEYLPFQETLETLGLEQLTRIRGGFSEGLSPRPVLTLGALPPIAGLICYEVIFPGAIVEGGERPGLLVNVTNDGWFGNTTGPRQHFHQARVRAVEEGLPLVRAANNGISAIVDPNGRIYKHLGVNERGVIDTGVPAARPPTIYARFGDWPFALTALLFAALALVLIRRRARVSSDPRRAQSKIDG